MDTIVAHTIGKRIAERMPVTRENLQEIKRELASKMASELLTNSKMLAAYKSYVTSIQQPENQAILRLLRRRSIRTLSGVAPITVLTKPYPCPGRCVYCPTERNMPKSYIASEPAAQRAEHNAFDPFKQTASRIQQLELNGHTVDKIELIVLGGTWSFYPRDYQEWFIQRCFDAANQKDSTSLDEAQAYNETDATHRIIGVTLETRPDYVHEDELWHMRKLGCTHVQIGVQSLDQQVLDLIKRDDSVEGIANATRLLKFFGFKFTYHLMPGLPGSTPEKDLATFDMVFTDERFQPDMLKIYPTVVVKSSLLYHWWKKGAYRPYDHETLVKLLIAIKKKIPPYVRINRLIRDIPGTDIIDGNMVTNLRQELQRAGAECKCIRCRETRARTVEDGEKKLFVRRYASSGGVECFISMESPDEKIIYAFVRLFLAPHDIAALTGKTAYIRELHTYGELISVGKQSAAVQHKGLGKLLLLEAEKIAHDTGYDQLAIISGIGVRSYYRKLGYKLDRTYMIKNLSKHKSPV